MELELLTDYDQHLFIESGIRGGVSVISHRYANANLPQLSNYDSTKSNEHLIYWDANNLYGWAMTQPLPTGRFEWLSEEDTESIDLDAIDAFGDVGHILEVDLGKLILTLREIIWEIIKVNCHLIMYFILFYRLS